MFKKIFICMTLCAFALSSCEEDNNPPAITFDSESANGLYAGDAVTVTGQISGSDGMSAFWFHSKLSEGGNLDEQEGGRLELSSDGSFSIPVTLEKTTFGVKVIAEDAGGRTVKMFPIILGEDALIVTFEGEGSLATIDAGEEFTIKGMVTSGTPITSLTYTVVKGSLSEPPIDIELTGQNASTFNITMAARTGMTGIRFDATNRGSLVTSKVFVIGHVSPLGPTVLFDSGKIEVKPDSVMTVSGSIATEHGLSSVQYTVFRETGSDTPVAIACDNEGKFTFDVTANGKITAIVVAATDIKDKTGEETIPVKVLYPERIEGEVMLHYKYLIFTDNRSFDKSYFSFNVAPYVLSREQAAANQAEIDLMYNNVFIADGNANNGAALFGANASYATTVRSTILTEGWSLPQADLRLARLPVQTDMTNVLGKTFDELDDSATTWDSFAAYANGKSSSNSVLRTGTAASTVKVGTVFLIKFGGKNSEGNTGITRNAIGIVRGKGGTPATAEGQSTGSWLEVEIKVRK
ncbi:hypothetical protein [uncultured Bacteroides sp.]|uniref:hypothetical protein n=1 Tax=uncultured Bacteroides sp. TaxID=162156 RepID=UPI0025F83D11|nr:hypothetical protein [uncultured Bacteroides sp.]